MTFISVLKQTDILFELTITQLELVASICTEQVFQAGDVIFTENTPGTELYVIASGSVDIQVAPARTSRGQADTVHTIATLRRGQSFGEGAAQASSGAGHQGGFTSEISISENGFGIRHSGFRDRDSSG